VIIFAVGTDNIPRAENQTLEKLAAKAKADPGNWINLEAYANDLGSRELNPRSWPAGRIEDVSHRLAVSAFPPTASADKL